jgi:hypothetical protein
MLFRDFGGYKSKMKNEKPNGFVSNKFFVDATTGYSQRINFFWRGWQRMNNAKSVKYFSSLCSGTFDIHATWPVG